jgi:hypothetical protein
MTLVIALCLFVHLDAEPYWYVAAVVLWPVHLLYVGDFSGFGHEGLSAGVLVAGFGFVTGTLAACLLYPVSRELLHHLLFSVLPWSAG